LRLFDYVLFMRLLNLGNYALTGKAENMKLHCSPELRPNRSKNYINEPEGLK